jgi:hypothetical protein
VTDPSAFPTERVPVGVEELPAKGWVTPGEVVWCDVCARRTYVWECASDLLE